MHDSYIVILNTALFLSFSNLVCSGFQTIPRHRPSYAAFGRLKTLNNAINQSYRLPDTAAHANPRHARECAWSRGATVPGYGRHLEPHHNGGGTRSNIQTRQHHPRSWRDPEFCNKAGWHGHTWERRWQPCTLNLSLNWSVCPDTFKRANLCVVPKKGRRDKSNPQCPLPKSLGPDSFFNEI